MERGQNDASSRKEPISHEIKCDDEPSSDDASVEWTALMGDTEANEDDQLAVAVVSVRIADGSTEVRKINFVNGGLGIVTELISGS